MADLNTFGEEVTAFRLGNLDYEYNFNSAGNLFFKEAPTKFNESFLKVPVRNSEYDYSKFAKFYNLSFEEFSPKSSTTVNVAGKEEDYKSQLSQLKAQISSSSASVTNESVFKLQSELQASRDIIVGLRIAAGEGKTDEDFSSEFPFYPKKDATNSNK